MRPDLFQIGELTIPSFWAMAFLGFFVAFFVVRSGVRRRGYGDDLAYDIVLWAYVGGWVGARLFMIPGSWDVFVRDPFAFLFSGSGWVWYGGLIGGTIAVCAMVWRRGVALADVADIVAPGLAIGQAIGRIGCELSGDGDYGVPTTLPWGMSYPNGLVPTTEHVHPAPFYEAVACVAIFAYLWRRQREARPPGDLFGRYLVLSAAVRFFVEFVRRNPAWLLGLTTAQWIAIGGMALGAVVLRGVARVAVRASG